MVSRHTFATQLFSKYPPSRFGFNPDLQQFQLDDATIAPADFATFRTSPREAITEEVAGELISNSDLLLGVMNKLYMMPRLNQRLKNLDAAQADAATNAATEAMVDVYAGLTGVSKKKLLRGNFHTDFRAAFIRPGHPDFNVLGNCACMGISPHGWTFGENAWDEGFGEFDMHNTDYPEQEIALLAGAGALAYLVSLNPEQQPPENPGASSLQ